MRYLMFKLGMPNVGSWNGSYSQQDHIHARVVKLYDRSAEAAEETEEQIKKLSGSYHYDFGDGWGASVTVKEVSKEEHAKIIKQSDGFNGYDWMIKSIMKYGEILNDESISEFESAKILNSVIKTNADQSYVGLESFLQAKREYLCSIKYDDIANVYTNKVYSLLTDRDIEFATDNMLENEASLSTLKKLPKDVDLIVKNIMSLKYDEYKIWSDKI